MYATIPMATSLVFGFCLIADAMQPGIQVPWFILVPVLGIALITDTLVAVSLARAIF